jgi:hypothetical protein
MSSPDNFRGSILNYITIPHPIIINPNELTDNLQSSILNYITIPHPMVINPNELTGQPPEFNIELHYNPPSSGN